MHGTCIKIKKYTAVISASWLKQKNDRVTALLRSRLEFTKKTVNGVSLIPGVSIVENGDGVENLRDIKRMFTRTFFLYNPV